jgi:hypothetical protein
MKFYFEVEFRICLLRKNHQLSDLADIDRVLGYIPGDMFGNGIGWFFILYII